MTTPQDKKPAGARQRQGALGSSQGEAGARDAGGVLQPARERAEAAPGTARREEGTGPHGDPSRAAPVGDRGQPKARNTTDERGGLHSSQGLAGAQGSGGGAERGQPNADPGAAGSNPGTEGSGGPKQSGL